MIRIYHMWLLQQFSERFDRFQCSLEANLWFWQLCIELPAKGEKWHSNQILASTQIIMQSDVFSIWDILQIEKRGISDILTQLMFSVRGKWGNFSFSYIQTWRLFHGNRCHCQITIPKSSSFSYISTFFVLSKGSSFWIFFPLLWYHSS